MATFEHNGRMIAYEDRGQGLPLVLLHGFPLDRRVWNAQVKGLSDRCRVIAVDLPGFGESGRLDACTMSSLADDVHALLRHLNALPCVLAGLSMGGYVALAFSKSYAADLCGLALLGSKAEADSTEAKKNRERMIELVRSGGACAICDDMMPKMIAPRTATGDADTLTDLRRIMENCRPDTIEHALRAMRDREDLTEHLRSIAKPALIVVGESDAFISRQLAEFTAAQIPHSKVAVIPGAGHMAPMENPQAVNAALADFVRECQSVPK